MLVIAYKKVKYPKPEKQTVPKRTTVTNESGHSYLKSKDLARIASNRDAAWTTIKWTNVELTERNGELCCRFFVVESHARKPSSDNPTKTAKPPRENPNKFGMTANGCSHHFSNSQ
jgi:hypothetical protein